MDGGFGDNEKVTVGSARSKKPVHPLHLDPARPLPEGPVLSSRTYVGRHRPAHAAADAKVRRAPKSLSAGFVLPTAAAAALVVTAMGASMAEATGWPVTAAPRTAFGVIAVAPQVSQQITAQAKEAQTSSSGLEERRAAASTRESPAPSIGVSVAPERLRSGT